MDAKEFNDKLDGLFRSALADGLAAGKMSAALAVGIVELHRCQFVEKVRILAQQQAAKSRPRIILPPGPGE